MNKFFSIVLTLCFSSALGAWGNRGHHEICSAATYLVQNKALKDFLRSREHRMGFLCNIPDIYWRDLPREQSSLGNPTHFINADKAGATLESLDTRFSKILKNSKDPEIAAKLGSLWWRADQFYRRALASAKSAAKSAAPKNIIEQQNRDLPFNRWVYEMHVDMGIMGHFVGDVMMPYHNNSDYDGWQKGRGGIHSFYEETCVDTLGADLKSELIAKASELPKKGFLDPKSSVVERMKAASLLAVSEIPEIEKFDELINPSIDSPKTPARRRDPEKACPAFKPLIVTQMARATALLAQLWDEIYEKGRRPPVKLYRSYEYPFMPPFVAPDYLEAK